MRAFKICSFNNIQICNTVLLTTVTMLYITFLAFPGGTSGKEPASRCRRQETQVRSLGQEDPLEEGVATRSSILAWRIPGTEEPGGLQSMGAAKETQLKRFSAQHSRERRRLPAWDAATPRAEFQPRRLRAYLRVPPGPSCPSASAATARTWWEVSLPRAAFGPPLASG